MVKNKLPEINNAFVSARDLLIEKLADIQASEDR